jgi:hypothetical protein
MHTLSLIALYTQILERYTNELFANVQRFSQNSCPKFTDVELLTCYLFSVHYEKKFTIKSSYNYISNHWLSWFPNLPSYQAYNARLNNLAPCLQNLCEIWWSSIVLPADQKEILLGDSFPIITCSAKRKAKVAPDFVAKSYCASKDLWYYGVKLHFLGLKVEKTLPIPVYMDFTPASTSDLNALRPVLETVYDTPIYLDKAYADEKLRQHLESQGSTLNTPIKQKRGECPTLRQFDEASQKQTSTTIAKVRQPVETFFSWMQEKTNIQKASKVRSLKGLLVHLWGKIAALPLYLLHF